MCIIRVCKVDSLNSMIWYLAVSYELLGVVSRPCLCVSREWRAGSGPTNRIVVSKYVRDGCLMKLSICARKLRWTFSPSKISTYTYTVFYVWPEYNERRS